MRGMIMLPQIDPKEWQLLVNSLQNFVITLENLDQIFNTHIFHPTQWQKLELCYSVCCPCGQLCRIRIVGSCLSAWFRFVYTELSFRGISMSFNWNGFLCSRFVSEISRVTFLWIPNRKTFYSTKLNSFVN